MSVDITRPLMMLCDENGTPIPNVSKSSSEVEAMEKASHLGDGTYILKRPDATIVVEQESVIPPPVVSIERVPYEITKTTVDLG